MISLDRTFRRWGAFCAVMFVLAAAIGFAKCGLNVSIPPSGEEWFTLYFTALPTCLALLVGIGSRFRAAHLRFIPLAVGEVLQYSPEFIIYMVWSQSGRPWIHSLISALTYATHYALVCGLVAALGLSARPAVPAWRVVGWAGVALGYLAGVLGVGLLVFGVGLNGLWSQRDEILLPLVVSIPSVPVALMARRLHRDLRTPGESGDRGRRIRRMALIGAGLLLGLWAAHSFYMSIRFGLASEFIGFEQVRLFSWGAAALTFDFLAIAAFLELMREDEPACAETVAPLRSDPS